MSIPLCRPGLGPSEEAAAIDVIRSGQLVHGPRVEEFERLISQRLGGASAVAVANGTAAIWVALRALGVGPGDEVIVPALTYPAPANVVELLGATVVPVDVSAETAAMDPELVEKAIGPRTKTIFPVHPFGIAADMKALRALSETRSGISLLEDAACAVGAETEEGPCGTLGDMACFSFHPRKVITTGEGGAVITSDEALLERARRLRNHGQTEAEDLSSRFVDVGLNLRLGDIQGALGAVQIGRLDEFVEKRRDLCRLYSDALSTLSGVWILPGLLRPGSVVQSLIVCLDTSVDTASVIRGMHERGVEVTIASYALHRLPYYRKKYGWDSEKYPVAEQLSTQGLTLPLYPDMNPDDIETIVGALRAEVAL